LVGDFSRLVYVESELRLKAVLAEAARYDCLVSATVAYFQQQKNLRKVTSEFNTF
jgi:hypothetical protein